MKRRVLGIEVDDDLFERWKGWFAPDPQPFLVPDDSDLSLIGTPLTDNLDGAELRDTFESYSPVPDHSWRGIAQSEFTDLPRDTRASLVRAQVAIGRPLVPSVRSWPTLSPLGTSVQADGHRFVWWPNLLEACAEDALTAYVEEGRRRSVHDSIPPEIWDAARRLLPGARGVAGTFSHSSGPNCFATVMHVAGVTGVHKEWVQRDTFENWIEAATRPGGDDRSPGTVLVWRRPDGLVDHAAIAVGGGWGIHKPSQGWMSPTKALSVRDILLSSRAGGRRLSRRRLKDES